MHLPIVFSIPWRDPGAIGIDRDQVLKCTLLDNLVIYPAYVLYETILKEDVSVQDFEAIQVSGPYRRILHESGNQFYHVDIDGH